MYTEKGLLGLPPSIKDVPYAPIQDIKFVGKSGVLKAWKGSHQLPSPLKLPSSISSSSSTSSSTSSSSTNVSPTLINSPSPLLEHNYFQFPPSPNTMTSPPNSPVTLVPPSDVEISNLLTSLSKCTSKPAILSLSKDYFESFVPRSLSPTLPSPLSGLYKMEYLTHGYAQLLHLADNADVSVTPEQCKAVESSTKDQSKSHLWFNMRTGRVTASNLKSVCVSDEATPPLSLIMSCCYPESAKFKTLATTWGCQHEATARQKYKQKNSLSHENLIVSDSGFFIDPNFPFLGASPDGLVHCTCCGEGICEIKVRYYNLLVYQVHAIMIILFSVSTLPSE